MLVQILGWFSEGLLALLLISALKGGFLKQYPLFYAYAAGWFLVGLFRFYVFTFQLDSYLSFYWYSQFLLVAGGYSILWQIYAHILNPYPGTARMARVLVGAVFVSMLIQGLIMMLDGQTGGLTRSVVRLERNLHSVQTILIIVLVMLVWYYSIPLGKNLRGLLLGYGFLVTTRLITLTLQAFLGTSFYAWWSYSEQACVLVTLIVWSRTLRSYQPNPVPEHSSRLEHDYELAAQRTADAIATARGYLAKAFLQ